LKDHSEEIKIKRRKIEEKLRKDFTSEQISALFTLLVENQTRSKEKD